MKLRYKLLILLILFFVFLLLKTDVFATSYNLSSVLSSKDKYVIYTSNDNKIYLLKSASSNMFGNYYDLSYVSDNNHFLTSKGNSSSSFMDSSLYVLENSTFSYVTNLNWQKIEGECLNLYNVKDVLYCYSDIKIINTDTIYVNSNPITDFSNVEINSSTSDNPLSNFEIVELEKKYYNFDDFDFNYYMRSNFFEFTYDNVLHLQLQYSLDNINFFNIQLENNFFRSRTRLGDFSNGSDKVAFCFEVLKAGNYYFRLYDIEKNLYSDVLEVNCGNNILVGSKENVNLPKPELRLVRGADENGNASYKIVTQFLSASEYENLGMAYRNITDEDVLTEYFLTDNISRIYSPDNTEFRFVFPVSLNGCYNFCFYLGDERSEYVPYYVSFNNLFTNDSNIDSSTELFNDFDNIPKLEFGEPQIGDNFDFVYYDSQWFDRNIVYSVYNVTGNEFSLNLDNEIILSNDGNKYKYRFKFYKDGQYIFFLGHYLNTMLLRGESTLLDVSFFNGFNKYEVLKNKLLELYNNSFGFIAYPFTLFFNLCDKFLHIEFKEPIINIPDIYVPLFENNVPLIEETSINFSTIIDNNSTFKIIHNLILICTDVFISFGFVVLFRKKWGEVFR